MAPPGSKRKAGPRRGCPPTPVSLGLPHALHQSPRFRGGRRRGGPTSPHHPGHPARAGQEETSRVPAPPPQHHSSVAHSVRGAPRAARPQGTAQLSSCCRVHHLLLAGNLGPQKMHWQNHSLTARLCPAQRGENATRTLFEHQRHLGRLGGELGVGQHKGSHQGHPERGHGKTSPSCTSAVSPTFRFKSCPQGDGIRRAPQEVDRS